MSTKADWKGVAEETRAIVEAASREMGLDLDACIKSPEPIISGMATVSGPSLSLSAASTYHPPTATVPVCVGMRFEHAHGSYYLDNMPSIIGYKIVPVPSIHVGEHRFELVIQVIPPSMPVPPAPVHDMTPVAAELAKLLEGERERLRHALADLSSMTAERDRVMEMREEAVSQWTDALVELRAAKSEVSELDHAVESLEVANKALAAQVEDLEDRIVSRDARIKVLLDRLDEVTSNRDELERELDSYRGSRP